MNVLQLIGYTDFMMNVIKIYKVKEGIQLNYGNNSLNVLTICQ